MTYAAHTSFNLTSIPDPSRSPGFYEGVPAKRAAAWLLDSLCILGLSLLALPFTAFTGLLFFPALMLLIGFFYRWFTIAVLSATPGMRFMGIVLREGWGQRLGATTAFWHTTGYSICVVMAPLQLISVVFMGTSSKGQGLHDLALNTVAINTKALHYGRQ